MRRLIVSSVLLFVVAAAMLHAQKTNFVPASDSRLAYVGRMSLNGQCVSWTYPGLQIHAAFTGTSLRMKTSPGSGFFMVEIDDREPFKIEASETDSVLLVADGLGAGEHRDTDADRTAEEADERGLEAEQPEDLPAAHPHQCQMVRHVLCSD